MRSYYKINLSADGRTASKTPLGDGLPNWYALRQTTHKTLAIGKFNLLSGVSFGGTHWFLINGPTQFDPVVISFTGLQLANQIFSPIPYSQHPLD